MEEYEVEIVTDLDEVGTIRVMANSPEEAEQIAIEMVENEETYLCGIVVDASVL